MSEQESYSMPGAPDAMEKGSEQTTRDQMMPGGSMSGGRGEEESGGMPGGGMSGGGGEASGGEGAAACREAV